MKLSIEPTPGIVYLNGLPCRIWKGTTETGDPIDVLVSFVRLDSRYRESGDTLARSLRELTVSVDRSEEWFTGQLAESPPEPPPRDAN